MKLDKFDREILRVMQKDATISMADLSQKVGLSHTPCWRRVKKMEADGLIRQKVTLLDCKKLNLGVSVFIYITLKNHDGDSLTDFEQAVQEIDAIVECHTTSGEKDYLLKVIVESIEEYEQLLKSTLTHLPCVETRQLDICNETGQKHDRVTDQATLDFNCRFINPIFAQLVSNSGMG